MKAGLEGWLIWFLTKHGDPKPWSPEEVQIYLAFLRKSVYSSMPLIPIPLHSKPTHKPVTARTPRTGAISCHLKTLPLPPALCFFRVLTLVTESLIRTGTSTKEPSVSGPRSLSSRPSKRRTLSLKVSRKRLGGHSGTVCLFLSIVAFSNDCENVGRKHCCSEIWLWRGKVVGRTSKAVSGTDGTPCSSQRA